MAKNIILPTYFVLNRFKFKVDGCRKSRRNTDLHLGLVYIQS